MLIPIARLDRAPDAPVFSLVADLGKELSTKRWVVYYSMISVICLARETEKHEYSSRLVFHLENDSSAGGIDGNRHDVDRPEAPNTVSDSARHSGSPQSPRSQASSRGSDRDRSRRHIGRNRQ